MEVLVGYNDENIFSHIFDKGNGMQVELGNLKKNSWQTWVFKKITL